MQAFQSQKTQPQDLENFYSFVRNYTEQLCEPLEIEDYIPQPIEDVSPPRWNVAHTTWFFEEMILKKFASDYKVFDENFTFLFNSYYNSVGDRTLRDHRGDLSRPTVKEIFAYRKYVDEKMREFLSSELNDEAKQLVVLGLNHEQQHQELLLSDLKYTFSCNPLYPVYRDDFALVEKGESDKSNEFVEISGGNYEIGFKGEDFHFDNELGRHTVYLHDFSISKDLLTNGEFAKFVEDGGYQNHLLWHAEGLDWVRNNQINAPLYWQKGEDGVWLNYTLAGLRTLKMNAPLAHISFYEASAFAE
ncbi:MAG: SUMF1/EgtB/PvdO family nonheme iron enzyme, partial [Pyrinomonadaceae bacterium]